MGWADNSGAWKHHYDNHQSILLMDCVPQPAFLSSLGHRSTAERFMQMDKNRLKNRHKWIFQKTSNPQSIGITGMAG